MGAAVATEFFGDGVLVSVPAHVEEFMVDIDAHGPLHRHHESGLIVFSGSLGGRPVDCCGVLLPALPGAFTLRRVELSGVEGWLVDASPGVSSADPVRWMEGPLFESGGEGVVVRGVDGGDTGFSVPYVSGVWRTWLGVSGS